MGVVSRSECNWEVKRDLTTMEVPRDGTTRKAMVTFTTAVSGKW